LCDRQRNHTVGYESSVGVSAPAGCSWSSSSEVPWITITPPGTGEGDGAINYTVAPNTGPTRVGTIIIAGDTFTVKQKKILRIQMPAPVSA
jgi:hypothetical protein